MRGNDGYECPKCGGIIDVKERWEEDDGMRCPHCDEVFLIFEARLVKDIPDDEYWAKYTDLVPALHPDDV